jgi:FAD/FMN-containing dehydrogenase
MQTLLDATAPKGRRYYWKSHYLAGLPAAFGATLAQHAAQVPSPHSAIVLFQVEGALNELGPDESPMGNRDATCVLNIQSAWESAPDDARNIGWARDAFEATRAFSTGGVYVNFLTEEEGRDRVEAAYGKRTLERLAAIKQRWDPENLFRHNKAIA